jgi:hypothetical protein
LKPISFKISDQLADRLAETYGNRNRGAQRAVESWNDLQIYTMFELREIKFTINELKFLIEFINRKTFIPAYASDIDTFLMELMKYEEYYNKQIDVDYEQLDNKLIDLTAAQIFFLSDWANCFYLNHNAEKDIDEYIKFLAKMDK